MTRHAITDRFFGALGMVVGVVLAWGALFLLCLGWVDDPDAHLYGLIGGSIYALIICLPGIPAFLLGRSLWRRSRSRTT